MKSTGDMDNRERDVPRIPESLEVNFDSIPTELQGYPFVCWKYEVVDGDVKKPPFNPKTGKRANVSDHTTWGSFYDAWKAYVTGKWGKANGIGINSGMMLAH